jgi:hypothetical protein
MSGAIPPLLQHAFMAWRSVEKETQRDNFTFYLHLKLSASEIKYISGPVISGHDSVMKIHGQNDSASVNIKDSIGGNNPI